jgi:hypothetical protein
MRTLSATEWLGAGLALVMTLGTVGYMAFKQNELAEATAKAKADRVNDLGLTPEK